MIIDSEKLASKLALKMAQESARIYLRQTKEAREIRRLLWIHNANKSISSEQGKQKHMPMLGGDGGDSAS